MAKSITRAGLIKGLALFAYLSIPVRAQDLIDPFHMSPTQQRAKKQRIASGELSPGEFADFARKMSKVSRPNLPDLIFVQNIELQNPDSDGMQAVADAPMSDATKQYLMARARPTVQGFKAVLALDPKHRAAKRALATMAADDGDWNAAKTSFESLLAEDPKDPDTLHRFAFAAYYQGDLDLALTEWAAALEANPEHADSWYGCGVAWLGRGLFESAEKALRKAVEFDPIHWRAREALIQALIGQAKFEEAKPMRELLRARAPQLPKIGDRIKVAVLHLPTAEVIIREALIPSVPWLFRIELFDQATPGGKPIKVMELRRDGEAYAWGLTGDDGVFHPVKPLAALPDLEQVLEEAK
ncbi:MAG: tetratricopeptide repeat protein [Planctomycetes bacterium]|nr:tetratricopeptide repeat protein [Planctomycetota bacterium]